MTINDVLYSVLTICIPFLTGVVIRYVKARYEGTLYEEAMDAILDAVDATQQTYVETLKKAGKFDADAQAEARQKAVEYALSTMSQSAIEYINKISGDVEKFIFAKIEARVAQNKIGG